MSKKRDSTEPPIRDFIKIHIYVQLYKWIKIPWKWNSPFKISKFRTSSCGIILHHSGIPRLWNFSRQNLPRPHPSKCRPWTSPLCSPPTRRSICSTHPSPPHPATITTTTTTTMAMETAAGRQQHRRGTATVTVEGLARRATTRHHTWSGEVRTIPNFVD